MFQTAEETKPRILVVDDDRLIGELINNYLSEEEYEVFFVDNGEGVLNYVKRVRPHIILLDVLMADKDGLEVLKQVKEVDPMIGVIMITGVKDEDVVRKALELGAIDYITKPLDLEYLETSLKIKLSALLE